MAPKSLLRSRRIVKWVALVLAFGVLITCVNIFQLLAAPCDVTRGEDYVEEKTSNDHKTFPMVREPIVRFHGNNVDSGHLDHVMAVFDRVGYVRDDTSNNWDVLWAHGYPFSNFKAGLAHLKQHQRVNHFPGTGIFTSKVRLVKLDLPEIPKAFHIPADQKAFMEYAEQHPDTKWVQKSSKHRGVKLVSVKEIDFSAKETFLQQYVDNPLLIEGRRFDFGIYVTITSVDPLRAYMNDGNWNVRFCPKRYEPFDPKDKGRYVIGENYLPIWKVLKTPYDELGYSFKEALFAQLIERGYDVDLFMANIQKVIRSVLLLAEDNIIQASSKFPHTSKNFFELVRFDFVVDNDLNVYVMECNLSPNLSTARLVGLTNTFQQVMYSMLGLVGVARPTNRHPEFSANDDERDMHVSERDIMTLSQHCLSRACEDTCYYQNCRMCPYCLTVAQKAELRRAFLEHQNRRQWRRVVPQAFTSKQNASGWVAEQDPVYNAVNAKNKWMFLWFRAKCMQDLSWCF